MVIYNLFMKNKTIVVKCNNWTQEIDVDIEIFDDVLLEACTRGLENAIKNGNLTVTPYIQAGEKNTSSITIYNTYKILINAGYHSFAKALRDRVKMDSKVDLEKEPIKS